MKVVAAWKQTIISVRFSCTSSSDKLALDRDGLLCNIDVSTGWQTLNSLGT